MSKGKAFKIYKRAMAFFMAAALVFSSFQGMSLTAYAAEDIVISDADLQETEEMIEEAVEETADLEEVEEEPGQEEPVAEETQAPTEEPVAEETQAPTEEPVAEESTPEVAPEITAEPVAEETAAPEETQEPVAEATPEATPEVQEEQTDMIGDDVVLVGENTDGYIGNVKEENGKTELVIDEYDFEVAELEFSEDAVLDILNTRKQAGESYI